MCGGREGLWCKMRHGVEEKFVKVCKGFHSGVETRVVMNGAKSRLVLRGVLEKVAHCLHWWKNWKELSLQLN